MGNLKSDALELIGRKVELNPFVLAVLEGELDLLKNSKINHTPYLEYYPHEELLVMLVRRFERSATMLLQPFPANQTMTFRGILLNDYMHKRQELLLQIAQLKSPD